MPLILDERGEIESTLWYISSCLNSILFLVV